MTFVLRRCLVLQHANVLFVLKIFGIHDFKIPCVYFQRPVGRPPMKDKSKTPQQQKSGPVKIRPSSSQVIVIPIQIAKDSAASLSQVNGADTKVTPSSAGAAQKAKTGTTSGVKKEAKDKELVAGIKATPKLAKKQVNKSDDELLSTTRRSKRSSNMSMKLAEWGLLPTGG